MKSFIKKEVQAKIGDRWVEYSLPADANTTIEKWYETLCWNFPKMKFRLVECKVKVIKESS